VPGPKPVREVVVRLRVHGHRLLDWIPGDGSGIRVLYPESERMPFRALIRRARDEGVLPEDIADLADAGAELLNLFSHPKGRAALTLGAAAPMLENTHRIVALVLAAAAQHDAV
jgi:hypothetical protein